MCDSETIQRLKSCRGILFDLDNTLYPRELGVFDRISKRIDQYVRERTGLPGDEVRSLRQSYIERHGTTLGGLMRRHGVDPDEYMDYVHTVPVEEILSPDKELFAFLDAIDLPKAIFTNASAAYAARVLETLDVARHFDAVIDLASTGYFGKPDRRAYLTATDRLGCDPWQVLFVDDLAVNVTAARQLGIITAHVTEENDGVGHVSVGRVTELGELFAGAPWFNGGQ